MSDVLDVMRKAGLYSQLKRLRASIDPLPGICPPRSGADFRDFSQDVTWRYPAFWDQRSLTRQAPDNLYG